MKWHRVSTLWVLACKLPQDPWRHLSNAKRVEKIHRPGQLAITHQVEDASSPLLTVTLTVRTAAATGLLIVAPPSVGKQLCNERLTLAIAP